MGRIYWDSTEDEFYISTAQLSPTDKANQSAAAVLYYHFDRSLMDKELSGWAED